MKPYGYHNFNHCDMKSERRYIGFRKKSRWLERRMFNMAGRRQGIKEIQEFLKDNANSSLFSS